MDANEDLDALRTRVEELETQNRALQDARTRGKRGGARARAALAVVLVLLAALLAPIAVIGGWARAELVDTDRFVQTFAPLAEKPAVQSFVSDQVVGAIDGSVDIDALVNEIFDGIDELGLPPRAAAAAGLLRGPAAEGVRSMIRTAVERLVASPQFAGIWSGTLRETHSRAIAMLQGDPNTALQLADDGTISLQLGSVIAEVKRALDAQGMTFADRIPEVDRSIPILASDSLVLMRTLYQLSVAVGTWLPWLVLGLLALGVAVAGNRLRTLAWGGLALTASLLLLAGGLGIGRVFFVGSVSPSIMPAGTAEALFGQLTELMRASVTAFVVLAVLIAIGAWLFGASRPAVAIRGAGERGFARIRAAADRAGMNPGGFGRILDRWRSALLIGAVLVTVLVLFLQRPASAGSVIGALAAMLLVLALVELLRRPDAAAGPRRARENVETGEANEAAESGGPESS